MVFEEITNQMIEEICNDFKFKDEHGVFPFEKERVDVTLSKEAIIILENQENKSRFVNNLILTK